MRGSSITRALRALWSSASNISPAFASTSSCCARAKSKRCGAEGPAETAPAKPPCARTVHFQRQLLDEAGGVAAGDALQGDVLEAEQKAARCARLGRALGVQAVTQGLASSGERVEKQGDRHALTETGAAGHVLDGGKQGGLKAADDVAGQMRNGGLPQAAAQLAELDVAIHGEEKLVHDKLPPGRDPTSGCLLSGFYRYAAHDTHVGPARRRKVSDLCA